MFGHSHKLLGSNIPNCIPLVPFLYVEKFVVGGGVGGGWVLSLILNLSNWISFLILLLKSAQVKYKWF